MRKNNRSGRIIGTDDAYVESHPVLGELDEYTLVMGEDSTITSEFEEKIQTFETVLAERSYSNSDLRRIWTKTKKRLTMLFDVSELYRDIEYSLLRENGVELSEFAKSVLIEAAVSVLEDQVWETTRSEFSEIVGKDDSRVKLLTDLLAVARISTNAPASIKIGELDITDVIRNKGTLASRFWALVVSIGGRYKENLEVLRMENENIFPADFEHLAKYKINETMMMLSAPYFLQDEDMNEESVSAGLHAIQDELVDKIYKDADRSPSYSEEEMDSLLNEIAHVAETLYTRVRSIAADARHDLINFEARKKFASMQELFESMDQQGLEGLFVGFFALDLRDIETIMRFKMDIAMKVRKVKNQEIADYLIYIENILDTYLSVFANDESFMTKSQVEGLLKPTEEVEDVQTQEEIEPATIATLRTLKNKITNAAKLDSFEIDMDSIAWTNLVRPAEVNFIYNRNNPHYMGLKLVWVDDLGEQQMLYVDIDIKRQVMVWSVLGENPDQSLELRNAVLAVMRDILKYNLKRAETVRDNKKTKRPIGSKTDTKATKRRVVLRGEEFDGSISSRSKKKRRQAIVEAPPNLDLLPSTRKERKGLQQVIKYDEDHILTKLEENKVRLDALKLVVKSIQQFNEGNTRHFKAITPDKPAMRALADAYGVDKLYVLRAGRDYRVILVADSVPSVAGEQHFRIVRINDRSRAYRK